ncbi:hypothetical protein O3P16_04485 [Chitinophagaceae bacterium LY-5]|uniref:Uncharacterized protein n=1 Tax=Polluticaenibacter yanchengensis TaxID=3014562 RepID=A0ABT4UGS5_9BACT|nr:hypothetical protein [Chitinophagaceae bacterium LY-5]
MEIEKSWLIFALVNKVKVIKTMEHTKKSTGKYWLQFFFWLIIISLMLYFPSARPWFWLILPMLCTSFVKAMDIM